MDTETIKNPDAEFTLRSWENFRPVFSHVEVVHHPPLRESDNPIVSNLLTMGYEVHETVSTYFCGFPNATFGLDRHFKANTREEFQIRLGEEGWLRWRVETPEEVWLTLFYIHPSHQGKGKGRVLFPQVTDALFKAGARQLKGEVAPSWFPSRWEMNVERLTRFYVRNGFTQEGRFIVKKSPYEVGRKMPHSDFGRTRTGDTATPCQSEAAAVLQSQTSLGRD